MERSKQIKKIKDSGVFLQFHVKKGLELHKDGTPMASIRSKSIENMKSLWRLILITVEGESGAMILSPDFIEQLKRETTHITKRGSSELDYSVIKFDWKPLDSFDLEVIYSYYSMIRNHGDTVNSKLKQAYGIEN